MKRRHECPTCGQHYCCPRSAAKCGSPLVYDCFECYVTRYARQLEATASEVSDRFRLPDGGAEFGDVCYAN